MNRGNRRLDPGSSGQVLLAAAFFALLAGGLEAVFAAAQVAAHRIAWVSYDVAWMAPLAYLVLFVPLALMLSLGSALLRRAVSLSVAVGIFAFLAAFSLLLPHEQLARWASAMLAAGVASQLARFASRNADRLRRILRGGAVAMSVLVASAGALTRGWRAMAERRVLSSLAAASPGAPNVLLIVLDTVRRSNLGLYGYARMTTPALDRRAREGVVFDRAVATAPWTLPSHGSLFTGRSAGRLGTDWRSSLRDGPRTLTEVLRARGYVTGGFVANLLYTSWESGLGRGFAHYDDYPVTPSLVLLHSAITRTSVVTRMLDDHSPRGVVRALRGFSLRLARVPADVVRPASSVTDSFLAWQQGAGRRPFFAFLNYFDAHGPYRAPEPWTSQFAAQDARPVDRYDGAIAWLDHEVGRLLDSLQRRGVLDQTIVVVTSDHGEQFGEHRLKGHANSLYLPLLEVPLLVRYPSAVPAGARVAALVSLRDVAATVLDLAGVHESAGLPGSSLTRYWRSVAPPEPIMALAEVTKGINVDTAFPNSSGPMHSVLDERLHYIHNGWGRDELYAWRSDSLELRNLAADPAMRGELVRLRAAAAAMRLGSEDGDRGP